jgi:hypothetical protein
MAHRREEVYNVTLAELLREQGASKVEAEQRHRNDMPDVLLEWFGLPAVIEAKYDDPAAAGTVTAQMVDRLGAGFGTLGLAIIYPAELASSTTPPAAALDAAVLRIRLAAAGRKPGPWREVTGAAGVSALLDQARATLVSDDELADAVQLLSAAVDALARVFAGQPGHADELVRLVTADEAAGKATPGEREAAFRIAALALITATMVQVVLSDQDPKVPKVPEATADKQRAELLRTWQLVLDHDYGAVFEIAHAVLSTVGDVDPRLGATLLSMVRHARDIVAKGVLGRHDLVGRVYHSLLAQQKYLATYYTSVPAATLLAALATEPSLWPDVDWSANPDKFAFTFADPACGTGTLLGAALSAVRRHCAKARLAAGKTIDSVQLGRRLIEDNIVGYDILAYAVQVCAATLLLITQGTSVTRSRLAQLPFGGTEGHLGSLDLLLGDAQGALFGAWGHTVSIEGKTERNVPISLPEVDLVIMNPPFTRSQGGSRLLGSLDPEDFPLARANLKRLAARMEKLGRVSAGLGALFVPLADRMVRAGGRMAYVLPKTMLTGAQWDRTRGLLAHEYHVESVVCSHETDHWNFSDSTQLAEILLVARKWKVGEERAAAQTKWLQLRDNPDNAIDALGVATALLNESHHDRGAELKLGGGLFDVAGEVFSRPAPVDSQPWQSAIFYKEQLLRAAESLSVGALQLPRAAKPIPIPVRALGEMGRIGYDRRDITDAFEVVSTPSGYPALWGTDADFVRSLSHAPNAELSPRRKPAKGRHRKAAEPVWAGAGRLLLAERLWLMTMRCSAIVTAKRCISNTWWTVNLATDDPDDDRILAVWLNSTLGLLMWVYTAEETRGPWMAVKKNKLVDMPVLDPAKLSVVARKHLLDCWDQVKEEPLAAIAKVAADPVRAQIDAAVAKALAVPADGLEALRQLFSGEPRLQPSERPDKKRRKESTDGQELLALFS